MSNMYAIKESTLTTLGDAVRKHVGEMRVSETVIAKTGDIRDDNGWFDNASFNEGDNITVVRIPGALDITATIYMCYPQTMNYVWIAPGEHSSMPAGAMIFNTGTQLPDKWVTKIFKDTDVITISFHAADAKQNENNVLYGYYAEFNGEVINTMTPLQMAEEINNLPPSPTAEELTITGVSNYRFANGGFDWFIKKYGNLITTNNISNGSYMFYKSSVEEIPFDLNFYPKSNITVSSLFNDCNKLTDIPKLIGCQPSAIDDIFNGCYSLRELKYESIKDINWSYIDTITTAYGGDRSNTFSYCCSLRSLPMEFLNHGNPVVNYSYSIYYALFNNCYVLDEVIDLPNPHSQASWTSNAFYSTFGNCYRLKNLTFALKDGAPYVCPKWKSQTIDLTSSFGWCASYSNITGYNSGITEDKRVTDDASYQALKDDPDWYTGSVDYSRYNHDSAVATINSLPDCSALGGNTIKFKGAAGAKTDGGAINTLTEEEIAVATAKGWTVSFA